MSKVVESQIITNIAVSDKRIESSLEKMPQCLFSSTMEFFIDDIKSLINFRRCSRKISSLCTQALHIHLGRIKELTLHHLLFIRLLPQNDSNTNPLFPFVPNITHLKFNYHDIIYSNSSVEYDFSKVFLGLNQNCENLRNVSLCLYNLRNKLFNDFEARFFNLECLELNFSLDLISEKLEDIINLGIKLLLTKCVNLKTLRLKNLRELSYQDAGYFSHCKDITNLNLNKTPIGSRGIEKIVENCSNLTFLGIRPSQIDDEAMLAICMNCRNLTQIEMMDCTYSQFSMLAKCTQLTIISIDCCHVIDSEFEHVLISCKKLKTVCILLNKISLKFDFSRFPQIEFFV